MPRPKKPIPENGAIACFDQGPTTGPPCSMGERLLTIIILALFRGEINRAIPGTKHPIPFSQGIDRPWAALAAAFREQINYSLKNCQKDRRRRQLNNTTNRSNCQ
jgi:hypothetical protein